MTAAELLPRPQAQRWWVSWYGAGAFTYHGPWWISGHEVGREGRATFCAAVLADTADAAQRVIADAHDSPLPPIEWRFVDLRGRTWAPFSDRFPRAAWMQWPNEEARDGDWPRRRRLEGQGVTPRAPVGPLTAGQLIEVLRRVPADSRVHLDVSPGRRGGRYAVAEVETEQLLADGPPNGLGGPTMVGTGVWVVTIR